jgi:uncharacterized protein
MSNIFMGINFMYKFYHYFGLIFLGLILYSPSQMLVADDFFTPEHKIVFQINSSDIRTQSMVLSNIINLHKFYGMDNLAIEVVAFGPGFSMYLQESPLAARISSLAMQNVVFSLCTHTLETVEHEMQAVPDLVEGINMVPFGAVRLVELQSQGYIYLRP